MKTQTSTKLILLLLLIAFLPLLGFGIFSLTQIRSGTLQKAQEANQQIVQKVSDQIEQYVLQSLDLLQALTENLKEENIQDWQKQRLILKYLNRFDRFKDIQILSVNHEKVILSEVYRDEDLTPVLDAYIPIENLGQKQGSLKAKINLMQMWQWVDEIHLGEKGFLNIYDSQLQLIATGDGSKKKEVFLEEEGKLTLPLERIFSNRGYISASDEKLYVGKQLRDPLHWTIVLEEPLTQTYAIASHISYILLFVLAALLLLINWLGYFIGRKEILLPIRRLTEGTQALARGDWDYQLQEEKSPEWNTLVLAFNRMVLQLKEVTQKLVREERHSIFGRIASGLAHDLKHPVSTLNSIIRNLKYVEDEEDKLRLQHSIQREMNKMNYHLDQLQNLTKETPYHPVPVQIKTFLYEVVESFKPKAKEQSVAINHFCHPEDLIASIDPLSLTRALSNLISNALQVMEKGGSLSLSAKQKEQQILICVKDSGPGMDEKTQKTIFEEFVSHSNRGLGLGLAITRKIVAQHGGRIWAESQLGQGTEMWIELPLPSKA